MKNHLVMESKRFKKLNYQFHPSSYWQVSDPLEVILRNVQGTNRRQMIRDYWNAGRMEELADSHLLDSLKEEQRASLGRIHPTFMGGEYLPSYKPDEVEIARIELKSTTADVISIRAQMENAKIRYSIVDEYETEFYFEPASSDKPLTLGQLVDLIDSADRVEREREFPRSSLAIADTVTNFTCGDETIEELDDLRYFSRVESTYYPELSRHYEQFIDLWYRTEKKRLLAKRASS